jgi:hypothetical protein
MIRGQDGQLGPVRADSISQRLFLASERLGQPSVFLARELADRIIEYWRDDPEPLDEAELHERVITLVREFGYPALARVYAEETIPTRSQPVWPLDVESLSRSGLLVLPADTPPMRLADVVLGPGLDPERADAAIPEAIEKASQVASAVTLDSPEWVLCRQGGAISQVAASFASMLAELAEAYRVWISVHLNGADAPAWATQPVGPLFAPLPVKGGDDVRRREAAVALGRCLMEKRGIRLYWHIPLAERQRLAETDIPADFRRAIEAQVPIEWVFDRSGEPVLLGPGLTRSNPVVLGAVGCHCRRLVEQISPSRPEDSWEKLGTLTRLALSAGRAQLQYLRRALPAFGREGFLLERSRLVLVPIGLEAAARLLCRSSRWEENSVIDQAQRLLATMQRELAKDTGLPAGTIDHRLEGMPTPDAWTDLHDAIGMTSGDEQATIYEQLRFIEPLHRIARSGTAWLRVPVEVVRDAEEFGAVLQRAARCEVRRVRFVIS